MFQVSCVPKIRLMMKAKPKIQLNTELLLFYFENL